MLFTNVRFLQELKEETTRMSRLKHLLVLISRILAVAAIVLAFAQPVIPLTKAAGISRSDAVSIFVDNSFSMESQSRDGSLFDVARRKAREIANAYPPSAKFQLLTNDFEAVHQRLFTREEFFDELDRVHLSPVTRELSEVVKRQSEAIHSNNQQKADLFLVSDFQKSSADISNIRIDSGLTVSLAALPVQGQSNLFIDSCWLGSPVVQLNEPVELSIKITNSGKKDAENIPVRLTVNGAQRAVASTPLAAGESITITMNFSVNTPGWQSVVVSLTDHPVSFDDDYYLSFNVREHLNVLSLEGPSASKYLNALFGNDKFFSYNSISYSQVDYAAFKSQDVIILNEIPAVSSGLSGELMKYLQSGGTVIWFPDSAADLSSYSAFLSAASGEQFSGLTVSADRVSSVDLQHPVFRDVFDQSRQREGTTDYPTVSKHFSLSSSSRSNRRVLMKLESNESFLSEYASGKGTLYVFAVPLNPGFSNLARHAIIVPLVYRMALLSLRSPAVAYTIGREENIPVGITTGGEESFHLINAANKTDVIPSFRVTPSGPELNVGNAVTLAGNYDLNGPAGKAAVIAMNYNRRESELEYLSATQLAELSASKTDFRIFDAASPDLTKTLTQLNEGVALWKYCVIAALLFLLLETLLLRFWKTS